MACHVIDAGHQRVLSAAGTNIRLETNDAALANSLQSCFPADCEPAQEDVLTFAIRVKAQPERQGSEPFFRGLAHLVTARFGDDIFVFDRFRRTATALIAQSTAADISSWRNLFLPIAIGILGPSVGVVPFHCACLCIAGKGVLITGLSGAGKSTLAVAAARSGCELVSDDWTYIRLAEDFVVADGLNVPVKLLPDAAGFFPELSAERPAPSLNGELAYEVDPRKVLGISTRSTCNPSAIFFLERGREHSWEVAPLPQAMVGEYFLKSSERLPPELPGVVQRRHAVIDAVSKLPALSFRYGGTPAEGAAWLAEAILREERAIA